MGLFEVDPDQAGHLARQLLDERGAEELRVAADHPAALGGALQSGELVDELPKLGGGYGCQGSRTLAFRDSSGGAGDSGPG